MISKESQNLQKNLDEIIMFVHPFPMTSRLALKIYRAYGEESINRLIENPYTLSRDVFGIGEQTALKIVQTIETKLDKTYSSDVPMKSETANPTNCGPGNGRLSSRNLAQLKQNLQKMPKQVLPCEWQLHNPELWTILDLKRAVEWWFGVSWAHDSSYRALFKKCGFVYSRKMKAFILAPAEAQPLSGFSNF